MYNKIKLLVFVLLVNGLANAQEISKEKFDKAVDYCACRFALAYGENYIANGISKEIASGVKEKEAFEDVLKPELEKCKRDKIDSSINYSKLDTILKNNHFAEISEKLSPVILGIKMHFDSFSSAQKDSIGNVIISGIYDTKSLKTIIDRFPKIDTLKNELTGDLKDYFFSQAIANTSNQRKGIDATGGGKRTKGDKSKKIEEERTSIWLYVFSGLNFALLILSLLLSHKKIKTLREELKEEIDKLKKEIDKSNKEGDKSNKEGDKSNKEGDKSNKEGDKSNKERDKSNKERDKSNKERDKSKKERDKSKKEGETLIKSNSAKPFQKQELERKILYASTPSSEGSFKVSLVTHHEKQGLSYYKFTLLDDTHEKAELELLNNKIAVKRAINDSESILEPVCKFNNALNKSASHIKTTKKGIVRKENDKWIVVNKAEITYE